MTKHTQASPCLLVAALLLLSNSIVASGQGRGAPESPGVRQKQVAALRAHGLQAAAAVTGSFIAQQSPHSEREAKTLHQLARESDLIVVGRMTNNRTWVDVEGKVITTDYGVVIERLLKGNAPSEKAITVSILGGRVGFPDGTFAEVQTPGLPRPLAGDRFLLFLKRTHFLATPQRMASAQGRLFAPVLTSQGMFYLSDAKGVAPRARVGHPLRELYARQPENRLIDDVAAVVAGAR